MHSRETAWARLDRPLDLLVIGGGITGAGVLLEASRRGLQAALVERGDFASGTSSRSSKLVHGGLRYLKEGKLRLTRESVAEREALLHDAPGLVEPMPFLMPQYRGKKPGATITQIGLTLYDALSGTRQRGYLSAAEALQQEPLIAQDALEGAHLFSDATTDDARLVLRLIAEAERFGGVALNYAEVTGFERTRDAVSGATVQDRIADRVRNVSAKMFVNATGVFADSVRAQVKAAPMLRPLRGSHLIIPHDRLPVSHAVAFSHPADGRPVFAYPWMGVTLAGTTDLDHRDDLALEPAITGEEFTYLLDALNAQFPGAQIGSADVLSTFAGVRPVVASGRESPSSESRDHVLLDENGLITITGGKLTTFRPMALQALRAACKRARRQIDLRPTPIFAQAAPTASQRLNGRYGAEAAKVLDIARSEDQEAVGTSDTTWVEVRYALRNECVVHLDDLLLRRTRLGLQLRDGAVGIFERLKPLCSQELGWDDARWQSESSTYRERIRTHYGTPA